MPSCPSTIACIISRNGNEATTQDGATLVHARIAYRDITEATIYFQFDFAYLFFKLCVKLILNKMRKFTD
jgi:hypothetical protein